MGKIIFIFLTCLFFSVSHAAGKPVPVSLWQSDEFVVKGTLPEQWSVISPEELAAIETIIPGSIADQSGEIVTGFQLVSEKGSKNSPHNPRIIIFAKSGEYVDQEMIQKTYAWFEKNKNLLAGMLADKLEKASIQNIEYIQNLPAILFQSNLAANDMFFTGLSTIIFMKKGILNIVCITEDDQFAAYDSVFRSFIGSISIPPALQHDTVVVSPAVVKLREIFDLLDRKWQPLLGVLVIIGVYGGVFRPNKERI